MNSDGPLRSGNSRNRALLTRRLIGATIGAVLLAALGFYIAESLGWRFADPFTIDEILLGGLVGAVLGWWAGAAATRQGVR